MRAARRAAGFTMVELIVVMILLGVVAAVAAPRLMGNNALTGVSLRDQLQAALRSAQKSAVARRRVVCATRAGASTLPTFALARDIGAAGCTLAFPNPISVAGLGSTPALSYGAGLPANLFFQPNGSITSDIGGANPVAGAISFTDDGATYTIRLDGVTGYVE